MKKSLYTRPDKPMFLKVRERRTFDEVGRCAPAAPIEIHSTSECHVTPRDIAEYMAACLEIDGIAELLEPHGGTGNLLRAVIRGGQPTNNIFVVERDYSLHNILATEYPAVRLHHGCFLEYAAANKKTFARIIANPPFKRIKAHMNAALELLGSGKNEQSILVALVPSTYRHVDAETLRHLDGDAFPHISVSTKIIRVVRGPR